MPRDWRVVKMGIDMFDMLHTYGLGVVIAQATQAPVLVRDEGCSYHLSSSCPVLPPTSLDVFNEIFLLPEPEEILHLLEGHSPEEPASLAVANLDGLLAALFTHPQGVRECSVWSLLRRQFVDPTVVLRALLKVHASCLKWKAWIGREAKHPSFWLEEMLDAYSILLPQHALPTITQRKAITAAMTLDPSLSYASRQPQSDGQISKKSNLTISGTRFATVLAYIGAMRFLRAQPVAGNLITYTVPLALTFSIEVSSWWPVLRPRDNDEPEQALVLQWLTMETLGASEGKQWRGLSFQVLQAQHNQAAISRSRGNVDCSWLEALKQTLGTPLFRYWRWVLSLPQQECPYEVHALVEALMVQQSRSWEAHLFDVAQAELSQKQQKDQRNHKGPLRLYSIDEVREVAKTMEVGSPTPLSCILERKEGTLRFGHALRQLKNASASSHVRELLEELASVRTRDQLMDILTRIMEICEVMDAKTYFLITPSDDDLKILLEDEEQYSAHTIAELLRLLSTLRYPAKAAEISQGAEASVSGNP